MKLIADAPSFTDSLTAWSTLGLAALTFVTVVTAIAIAARGNKRDDRLRQADKQAADERFTMARDEAEARLIDEREAAEKRLLEERAIAEQRVQDERTFATAERIHERQAQRAAVLLEYVASLRQNLAIFEHKSQHVLPNQVSKSLAELLDMLTAGTHIDAPLLGNAEVEERYRTLVHLVLSITAPDFKVTPERTVNNLRNYAKFVKLSLIALVDGTELPKNEGHAHPYLGITMDNSLWYPSHMTPEYMEESNLDPNDPHFKPLP